MCRYLLEKEYRIVARNYRIRGGEIDIIAEDGFYMAFVEVKTRRPGSLVTGFEAVNRRKKELIIKTAADYCTKHKNMLQPRFDTAEVIFDGVKIRSIEYIENAFDATGCKFIF